MKSICFISVVLWSSMLSITVAQEDILMLKDGRIFDGLKLEAAEGGYVVHYEHGDILVPSELIEEVLWLSRPPAADGTKSNNKLEKELQKAAVQRRKQLADIEAHSEWKDRYKIKTKYFNFEHTMPPFVFEGYKVQMEAYFAAFCKEWKVRPQKGYAENPKETRLLVCFYDNKQLFHQVSGARRGVLGYFRFVKPLELDIYYDRLDPDLSREVMFHEANHYLQKLVNMKFSYPHWPGEALAEFYGASEWDPVKKKLTSGLILEGRLTEVQADITKGDWMTIARMLTEDMYEHYTWGWTFVHFLMNTPEYEKKFRKFYLGLANDKNVKRQRMGIDNLTTVEMRNVFGVFKQYMGIKDDEQVRELEREWHSYIESELHVTSSHGKEKAAKNAARSNRPIRARRLYTEAVEAGDASALSYHNLAKLILSRSWSTDESQKQLWKLSEGYWMKAIELSPMTSEFYFDYGKEMVEHADQKEGARLQLLAADIDPKMKRKLSSLDDIIDF